LNLPASGPCAEKNPIRPVYAHPTSGRMVGALALRLGQNQRLAHRQTRADEPRSFPSHLIMTKLSRIMKLNATSLA